MKKNIIFLFSLVSAVAHAGGGCTKIDPTIALHLQYGMTIAQVDSVVGCGGEETTYVAADGTGRVMTDKNYDDPLDLTYPSKKTEYASAMAIFENGILIQANSGSVKIGQQHMTNKAVMVTRGWPPRTVYCHDSQLFSCEP